MLKEVQNSLYGKVKASKLNIVLNALLVFVILVILCEMYFYVNFTGVYIVHDSMSPTLTGANSLKEKGGDYIYIDKKREPTYGDIVVQYTGVDEYGNPVFYIKRVIAMGGDTVKLNRGKLYIKYKGESEFKQIEESYIKPENNDATNPVNTYRAQDGHLVAEGYYFLLGDNRNVSTDSRKLGSFPIKDLDGVVTEWSVKYKSFFTAMYNFSHFDLPNLFGINNKNNKLTGAII